MGLLMLAAARCLATPVSDTPQVPAAPGEPLSHLTFACTAQTCTTVRNVVPPPQDAVFERGEIDLTGDGIPEGIERHGEALVILKEGQEVWRSPTSWRVLDADLGDPNDDGRYEIMVAFWKDDTDGVPRSHPFIVGYRGGHYREVWGGSPVAEPIYEVALADVDGDGLEDLVVLDAVPGKQESMRTVSIWRWHGWGFSLMWRSEPGAYQDLVAVKQDNAPAQIVVFAKP